MKRLLIYIILISIGSNAIGQDPELIDNEWYLEKVIIDGETIFPPYFPFEPKVGRIYFEIDGMAKEFCDIRGCEASYDPNENIFMLGECVLLPGSCDRPEYIIFAGIYDSIFYEENNPINPFAYVLELGSDGILVLTITNAQGNQAIFGNKFLSTAEIISEKIKIYPNPSSSKIFLKSQKNTITKIELHTMLGESIQTLNNYVDSVDLSHLATGVYLLRIYTEHGSAIKKVIKQ